MSAKSVSTIREIEAKFRVHPPFLLPPLDDARTGVFSIDQPVTRELTAIYWDTSDLRMAREGVTLRHRSGEGAGKDGWHLKLPVREAAVPDASTGARDEVHAKGEPDATPESLRNLVTVWVRTGVLGPVATLVTRRTSYVLRDEAGDAVAELVDDLVSVLSHGRVAGRFREIEIEDLGNGAEVMAGLGALLRAGGAVGGEFVPKVVRALGPQATAEPDPPLPRAASLDAPARCLVRDVLRRYVRVLMTQDVAARRSEPDAVHRIRVAARRLRSALKTFRSLLDAEWANALREELKWLADSLGEARDSEVLLEHLTADLDALPADLVIGPVRARITERVGGSLKSGSDNVLETLESERYVVLLERLVDAAWEPLCTPNAERPTRLAVPALIEKSWRHIKRDVHRLDHSEATDHDWHQVRIDAKALRYACEALEPTFGKPAKQFAKQAEAIQELLGRHQDAAIAMALIRGMATGPKAGPIAFTLGLLHARQQEAASQARADFPRVWAEAARSRHRRWLTP